MGEDQMHVLDVGQCTPDHMMIARMLTENFDVAVDRVANVAEALSAMRERKYGLILVNRLIDEDRSDGLELLRQASNQERNRDTPIMMVSNLDDAQERAVHAGAVRGFGKSAVGSPGTTELLNDHLPRRAS